MSYGYTSIDDLPLQHQAQAREQLRDETPTLRVHAEYIPTEAEEQATLFQWADAHPVACVMYANVNGQYRRGQRPEPGLKAGVPDVFLPVARGGKHGLYIELKRRKGGKVSEAQKGWMHTLREQGYAVELSYGADEAIALVERYLEGQGKDG